MGACELVAEVFGWMKYWIAGHRTDVRTVKFQTLESLGI